MTKRILIAFLAALAQAGAAHAQLAPLPPLPFPLLGPGCNCVSDPPTEAATARTAASVTTGGGAGNWTSNSGYIESLDSTLLSGINSANFAREFPGWTPLPPTSSDLAKQITSTTMTTYASAVANAQSQMQELEGESFGGIEQLSASAQAVLFELQVNADIGLGILNELKLTRQLLADLVVVEATKAGEELNERAQAMATHQASMASQP
jgi:hypothetical protein